MSLPDAHAVPEEIRFSLVAMRERAALAGATLIVESMPDNGTSILVRYAPGEAALNIFPHGAFVCSSSGRIA